MVVFDKGNHNKKQLNLYLKTTTAVFTAVVCLIFAMCGCSAGFVDQDTEQKAEQETMVSMDRLIAHGGGSVYGYDTTNSLEAVLSSVDKGFSLIELDMNITSDNEVVMVHDWDKTLMYYYGKNGQVFEGPISLVEFEKIKVHDKFQTLTLDKLVEVMSEDNRFKIITDAKDCNLEVLGKIAEEYPEMFDRFIPQIYQMEQYEEVKTLGYENIILTLYMMESPDGEEIEKFCKENNILAVTAAVGSEKDGIARYLTEKGIKVYRHPVNSYEEYEELVGDEKAYGVYTSELQPFEAEGQYREYYLMQPKNTEDKESNKESDQEDLVKLTDYVLLMDRTDCADYKELSGKIKALQIHGLKKNEEAQYYIDGVILADKQSENVSVLGNLKDGKHTLTIGIWNTARCKKEFSGITLKYLLYKDGESFRVTDLKYKYRIDATSKMPDIEDIAINENLKQILKRSFISCADEYYYYNDGQAYTYSMDGEYLYALKGDDGKVYVPVAEAACALGARNVEMDANSNIVVEYRANKYIESRNGKNCFPIFFKTAIKGEFLGKIFSREVLAEDGLIVILPENFVWDEKIAKKAELLTAAKALYIEK